MVTELGVAPMWTQIASTTTVTTCTVLPIMCLRDELDFRILKIENLKILRILKFLNFKIFKNKTQHNMCVRDELDLIPKMREWKPWEFEHEIEIEKEENPTGIEKN